MTGSSSVKESCRSTLLKRWMLTEMRCKRNADSLSSPDTDEMRRPSAFRNYMAEVLRAPRFSAALGCKKWSAEGHCIWPISSQQLALQTDQTLLQPQQRTNRPVYSQPWHPKPFCHGINESPSGRLLSCLYKPVGSFVDGTPAELRACQTISFRAWSLAIWPGAFLQTMA